MDFPFCSLAYGARPSICSSMSVTSFNVDCTSSCTNCNRTGLQNRGDDGLGFFHTIVASPVSWLLCINCKGTREV